MTIRPSVVLPLFLTVVSAFGQYPPGQQPLAVDPPDPTSKDAVTLLVQQFASCPPPPEVTRSGFEIAVTLQEGLCLSPPVLVTQHVELGTLPAGEYHVAANYSGGQQPATLSFTVLDANSTVSVSPSIASSAGGAVVTVEILGSLCVVPAPLPCGPPTITFGGIPATNIVVLDGVHLRATTPPHTAGAVEVRVTDSSVWSSFAFRYFDPAAPPSPKFFEKILVPVIYNGPGALGSNWVTELSLRNDNDYSVEPWHAIGGSPAIPPAQPLRFGSGSAPNGLFLVVPREAAAGLSFHAAVRDTSQSDREWGTEIPVIHEESFSYSVELLDLPVDPRFRTMLRVYSERTVPPNMNVGVNIYSLDDGHSLRSFYWPLSNAAGCTDPTSCSERPAFAAVSDLTSGLSVDRVGIRITSYVPIWAFATITNNETQHVAVVSPQ